ncbi:unnamed protein product, partial [Coregonus sp. 'balchen']
GCLLYRDMSNDHSTSAIKINPETLEHEGTITMPGLQADGQSIVFTDGEYINQIAACKDVSLIHTYIHTHTHINLLQGR